MDLSSSFFVKAAKMGALAVLIVSCSQSSEDVETESMHFDAKIIDEGRDNIIVTARLDNGSSVGINYRLTPSDYFETCVTSSCEILDSNYNPYQPSFGSTAYSDTLPLQAGEEYIVSLHREENTSALDSMVSLPEGFELIAPISDSTYTDGDSIIVRWFPAGIDERVSAEGSAICEMTDGSESVASRISYDTNDDGEEIFAIEDVIYVPLERELLSVESCEIRIRVTHERKGTIDGTYAGGSISAEVRRDVVVNYFPLP